MATIDPTIVEKVILTKGWSWQQFKENVDRSDQWYKLAQEMCRNGELRGLRYSYVRYLGGKKAEKRILDSINKK